MIHIRLLATARQAIDHGYAVLLCAIAVVLGAGLRGGRGWGHAGLHVLLHVGVVRVEVGGEEGVVVHSGGVEMRGRVAAWFAEGEWIWRCFEIRRGWIPVARGRGAWRAGTVGNNSRCMWH